jgi:hypothetical protein
VRNGYLPERLVDRWHRERIQTQIDASACHHPPSAIDQVPSPKSHVPCPSRARARQAHHTATVLVVRSQCQWPTAPGIARFARHRDNAASDDGRARAGSTTVRSAANAVPAHPCAAIIRAFWARRWTTAHRASLYRDSDQWQARR